MAETDELEFVTSASANKWLNAHTLLEYKIGITVRLRCC